MNKVSSFFISIILHFFILKSWVYIIDNGSLPERHKIDLAETVLDLNSFKEVPKKASQASSKPSAKTTSQISQKKFVEDVGPLLKEEDLEIENSQQNRLGSFKNFQIRSNAIESDAFQIKRDKRIVSNDAPSISKKNGNKNITKKAISKLSNIEYNVDEGMSSSKVGYSGDEEGALVEASSKLENAFWIKKPQFSYPKAAEKEGVEGTVKLKVNVNSYGTVTKAIVAEKAHPILDEAALRDIYKGKIGAINSKNKNRISAEVIVIVPYKFGK